jgi:hypothetical protein
MRTFPDRAEIELRQNDLFGERGPDSAEAYRDAVVKDCAGLTVTIPFGSARPGKGGGKTTTAKAAGVAVIGFDEF